MLNYSFKNVSLISRVFFVLTVNLLGIATGQVSKVTSFMLVSSCYWEGKILT